MPEEPGSENSTAKRSSASKTSGKPALAVVQLLDDKTLDVYVERKAKGEKIFDEVCAHLDLREKDYFGLNYQDKSGRKTWLDLDKRVGKALKAEPWKLDFEVKFYPKDPSQLQEDFTRYLLCLQVRNDILSGKLPCSFVTHAMLGSYLVQSQLGDYSAEEYPDASYLSGFKFCPDQDAAPGLAERVMTLHKGHKGQTPAEAELHYLENAKKLSMYGVDMHPAKDSEGVDILLGVNSAGIQVYQEKLRINRFAWPKILKISYRRNNFYIKIRPGEFEQYEQTVGFKLDSSRAAKNLWKVCVDQHTFFRLMSADSTKRPGMLFPRLGSLYRFNRKTQAEVMVSGNPRKDGDFLRHHSLGPSRSLDPLNKPSKDHDDQLKRHTMSHDPARPAYRASPKKPVGGVAVLPIDLNKRPKSDKDNGRNGLPANDLEDEEKENRSQRIEETTTPVKDDGSERNIQGSERNIQSPSSGGLKGIFGSSKDKKSKDKGSLKKDQDSLKKDKDSLKKDKDGLKKDKDKDSLKKDKDKDSLKKEKDKDGLKKEKDKDGLKKEKDKDSKKKGKSPKAEKIAVAETVSGEFVSGDQKSLNDQETANLSKSSKDGEDGKGKDSKGSKDSKSKKDQKDAKGDDEGSKSKGLFAFKPDKKEKDKKASSKDRDNKKSKFDSRKSSTSEDSKNLDSSLDRSKTPEKDRSLNDTSTSPYTKVYEYTAEEEVNHPKPVGGFSYEGDKVSPSKSGSEKSPTSPGRTERATAFNYAPGDTAKVEGDHSGPGKKFFSIFGSKRKDHSEKQTKDAGKYGKGDSSLDKSGSPVSAKSESSGPVTSTPTGESDKSKKSKKDDKSKTSPSEKSSKDKSSTSEKPAKDKTTTSEKSSKDKIPTSEKSAKDKTSTSEKSTKDKISASQISAKDKTPTSEKSNSSYVDDFLQAERGYLSPAPSSAEDEPKVGPKIVKTTTKSQITNKGGTLTQNVEESIENVNTGEVTHSSLVNTAEGLDDSKSPLITATAVTTRTATTLEDLVTNAKTSEVQEKTVATSTSKQGSRQEQRVVTQEVRATTVVNDPQIERSKSSSSLSSDDSGTPIDGEAYYPDRPQGPIVETETVVYSRPVGEDGNGDEVRTSSPPLVPTVAQRLEDGTFSLHGTITSQTITSKTRTVETLTYKTEKDGVVETRVEQKITIQSDGDPVDHEKALNDAIQEATAMNPDLRVEKIEIQQESAP